MRVSATASVDAKIEANETPMAIEIAKAAHELAGMDGGIRHYQNQAFFKEKEDGATLYHADNLACPLDTRNQYANPRCHERSPFNMRAFNSVRWTCLLGQIRDGMGPSCKRHDGDGAAHLCIW